MNSFSQLDQDLFVLKTLNYKTNGYFIEFGATDGITINNTYLLEKNYSWSGILVEPSKFWHEALLKNRNVHIDVRCVWSVSGKTIPFVEAALPELSTVKEFIDSDFHANSRSTGIVYDVDTISLNDLLYFYNAPNKIDYLSIDTEGSEYLILNNFNFEKYDIKIITVEHNFTNSRILIYDLLVSNGYTRIEDTDTKWDDWYVKN